MQTNDPVLQAEKIAKEAHDSAGKYTQPVLRRYPLLFSFLIFFSAAAILHGFEMVTEQIELFEKHPTYLILIGAFMLFITGMLYKSLDKRG
jgi:hypothetical protein